MLDKMTEPSEDKLLTVKQVSKITGKRTGTLRKAIYRGYVQAEKLMGRWVIPCKELERLTLLDETEQDETGQEQEQTGQNGTEQDRIEYLEQDETGQSETEQDIIGQDEQEQTGQNETKQDRAGQNKTATIPLDYYHQQLTQWEKDRDQLRDGLMMYRFQFEELARRIKALPVPPELVAERLKKMEEELEKKAELETRLQEEQKARVELEAQFEAEKKRAWWKKLFGIR